MRVRQPHVCGILNCRHREAKKDLQRPRCTVNVGWYDHGKQRYAPRTDMQLMLEQKRMTSPITPAATHFPID
jgi:hypothetical protein